MTTKDGLAYAPGDPGIGIDWDRDAVKGMSVEEFSREIRQ